MSNAGFLLNEIDQETDLAQQGHVDIIGVTGSWLQNEIREDDN